ncbi:XdhC/CoxI family protein [Proteiniborus sp. MB09-C3]|uniref:XdhC family protein n=1 Tax=Proteiniborus sp. MB09-C3 TaxID=3050072 RepID=UPI002556AECF|nr:XdhC/CoxI family protein [Proteiniborus sp. MB09-C3]WIV12658.1 XdhC family protein [Proteiniborus sp. MB09-C3]
MFSHIYRNLSNELSSGNELVMLTFMKSIDGKKGSIVNKIVLDKDSLDDNPLFKDMNEELRQKVLFAFDSGNLQLVDNKEETILIEPYFPRPRLIILGGGHIAKPLSEFGARVGFSVVVVDDRPTFANSGRFPEASEVICESFENCFSRLNIKKSDFIVIVTRGHRHDGVCLRNSLKYNTAYLGMIGSKRRVKAMKEELLNEGYSKEQIEKLNSPIGLDIGAITPEEIAVSIIAQVISFRRARGNTIYKELGVKFNWPEFDDAVIEEMTKETEVPRALITIISSKGSVPRKAGAKMIVWLDGKVMGSIGGGCSEANIITIARNTILNNEYTIEHVDMTGDVAEDEGMVCGGIMDVLIESF